MKNIASIIIVVVFFSLTTVTWAKPADSAQAKNAVKGWLKSEVKSFTKDLGNKIGQVDTYVNEAGQPIYFIVNLKPSGFIIVPADDEVEPIVGFSSSGQYDPSDENPLGALVTRDLPGRMAALRGVTGKKAPGDHKATKKWTQLEDLADEVSVNGFTAVSDVRVSPLVQSKWNQEYAYYDTLPCYNYYTPNQWPSGCVATAFAQLMRYHRWPTTAVGALSKSYEINSNSYTGYLKGGDGSGGAYDWDLMPLTPDGSTGDPQRAAIGALCWDVGISVGMDYTSSGSGAYTGYIARDLKGTFNYSNALYARTKPSETAIPSLTLQQIINPNLDAASPVVLSIINGSYGGHAVLADGYGFSLSTQYHHLNMGWGGPGYTNYDLWYNLPDIDSNPAFNAVIGCVYNVYTTGTGEILSGRVTNLTGAAIHGATITATASGHNPLTTTSNSNGIYSFSRIPGGMYYDISCSKSGMAFITIQQVYVGTSEPNSLTTGNKWGNDFVDSLPHPPVASNVAVSIAAGSQTSITFNAVDEGLPNPPGVLSYIVTALPSHGKLIAPLNSHEITMADLPYTLGSNGSSITYQPCSYFVGSDQFKFKANDGGIAPDGGDSNTATVNITISQPSADLFVDDFTNGFANGWTVVDGSNDSRTWSADDPGQRGNTNNWSGKFAIIDSWFYSGYALDEQLVSPVINCSEYRQISLEFSHYFRYWSSSPAEIGDVDISVNGGIWINIARYTGADNSGTKTFDLSGYADYADSLKIRWHYYNASDEYYWGIDNVKVTGNPLAAPLAGDIGGDCTVNFEDFAVLAAAWMSTSGNSNWNAACDISLPADSVVNAGDLAVMIGSWLESVD